jgi:hypothetical protein
VLYVCGGAAQAGWVGGGGGLACFGELPATDVATVATKDRSPDAAGGREGEKASFNECVVTGRKSASEIGHVELLGFPGRPAGQ